MDKKQNQERIRMLQTMLLEMAFGNFHFRVTLTRNNDEIDEMAAMLNSFSQKMNYYHIDSEIQKETESQNQLKKSDADVILKVLDYIQNNLEEKMPSTKELSKKFATNEFTLKDNFRKILKTSIYQFYNDERLKKAAKLMEQTEIPLKEIALLCGFNDYTNFYKSFKKKFNDPPSVIVRKSHKPKE